MDGAASPTDNGLESEDGRDKDMPGKAGSGALRTDAMPKARVLVMREKENAFGRAA